VVLEQLHARHARGVEVLGHTPRELALVRAYVEEGAAHFLGQLAQDAAAVLFLAQPEDSPEITLWLLDRRARGWREFFRPATAGLGW
jgi:uncharacterized Zn finger protein